MGWSRSCRMAFLPQLPLARDLRVGEGRPQHHVGHQVERLRQAGAWARAARTVAFSHPGAGAERRAEEVGLLGDLERAARARALVEHVRGEGGEARAGPAGRAPRRRARAGVTSTTGTLCISTTASWRPFGRVCSCTAGSRRGLAAPARAASCGRGRLRRRGRARSHGAQDEARAHAAREAARAVQDERAHGFLPSRRPPARSCPAAPR